MESPYWVYIPSLWVTDYDGRSMYDATLAEMQGDLKKGLIKMGGMVREEARLTTMYSNVENAVMKYSGRVVTPIRPTKGGCIDVLLDVVNADDFRELIFDVAPDLRTRLPKWNAVFVNWYRNPMTTGGKVDNLGAHSDDTRELDSEIIFSLTFCESGGHRLFSMFDKASGNKVAWEAELKDGDGFLMLEGCQKLYKHAVSSRKTHLDKSPVIGGRINFTFRILKLV